MATTEVNEIFEGAWIYEKVSVGADRKGNEMSGREIGHIVVWNMIKACVFLRKTIACGKRDNFLWWFHNCPLDNPHIV